MTDGLLVAMKAHTKAVKPKALGVVGRENLFRRFMEMGCVENSFVYRKVMEIDSDGLPVVVETAFGWYRCPRTLCRLSRIWWPLDYFPGSFSPHETQKAQGTPRNSQVIVRASAQGDSAVRVSADGRMAIEEAVTRSTPTGPGTRRAKLLELVRRIKFMPEFANLPATKIDCLRPFLKLWWKLAKPHTSGKHAHFWQSWQDFVFAWEEARVPYGATMQAIMEKACCCPPPRKAVEKYGEGSLRGLLAALCRELQRFNGDKPFHLSGRTAGPLIGVSDTQAWCWLKRLEKDKIIVPVKKYPRGKRLATEFRYVGDM